MAISLQDMPMFEVEFLKNGSEFFNNTSSPTRGEFFFSYKPSQLIGRARLAVVETPRSENTPNNEMWPAAFMT